MNAPFLRIVQEAFETHARRPAILNEQRTYSYSDLATRVREGAGWLQSLGVNPADRVVLCTADKRALLFGHLAALYAGAVSLPLNPRFTREELRFFLNDSGARVAIVGNEPRLLIEPLQAELPQLKAVVPDVAMLDAPKNTHHPVEVAVEDACLMLYSSGTTGWPKGVVHTHGNVAAALLALQRCWRMSPDDIVLNVLPLFHIHGLCFASLLTLMSGGCLMIDEFEPQLTLNRIAECTVFMAVPTIYYRFLEQANFRTLAKSFQRTRLFTCGSGPIRTEVLPELEAIVGKPMINRYGMTEAFVIASLPLEGPWPAGSVGPPLEGIEVRIGEPGANGVGAVQLRGPNLFARYWNKPDETQAAFASGWFDTGDLGFLDANGFLTLVGRKNDLIITNGYNVYPQVVERVINDCPGVRESAVLGVADPRKGERVAAVIVRGDPALTEERLRAFWSERLVEYQRPKAVIFVDSLPRNAMGKVLRRELRDSFPKEGE